MLPSLCVAVVVVVVVVVDIVFLSMMNEDSFRTSIKTMIYLHHHIYETIHDQDMMLVNLMHSHTSNVVVMEMLVLVLML